MTKPRTTFQLVPLWPPMFEARLPALLQATSEEAARSAAASSRRRALLDSEDLADRRRGAGSIFGLSRQADERIHKGRQ
jgi:hypothetical protein